MSIYPIASYFDNIVRPMVTKTVVTSAANVNSTATCAAAGIFGAGSIITNINIWNTATTGFSGTYSIQATGPNGTGGYIYLSLGTGSYIPSSTGDYGLGKPLPQDCYLVLQQSTGPTGTANLAVTYLAEARASMN